MIEVLKMFYALIKLLTLLLDTKLFSKFYDGYTGTPNLVIIPFWGNGIAALILSCMTLFLSYNQGGLEIGLIYFWIMSSLINVLLHMKYVYMMPTVKKKIIFFLYMIAFSLLIGFFAVRLFAIIFIILMIFLIINLFIKLSFISVASQRFNSAGNFTEKYELENGVVISKSGDGTFRDSNGQPYVSCGNGFIPVD